MPRAEGGGFGVLLFNGDRVSVWKDEKILVMVAQNVNVPNTTEPQHLKIVKMVCMYMFSSVAHSCPTLCDPISCSTPRSPVHHQLPELAQTHVYRVGETIQ